MTLNPGDCYSVNGQYYGKVVAFDHRGGSNYVEIEHLYGDEPVITKGYLDDSTLRDLKKVECVTEAIKYYTELFNIAKGRFIQNKTMETLDRLLHYLSRIRDSKLSMINEEYRAITKQRMLENDYDTVMEIINKFTSEEKFKLLEEVYDKWSGDSERRDIVKNLLMKHFIDSLSGSGGGGNNSSAGGGGGGGGGGNNSSAGGGSGNSSSSSSYPVPTSRANLTNNSVPTNRTNLTNNSNRANLTDNSVPTNRTNLTDNSNRANLTDNSVLTINDVPRINPSRRCAEGLCTISGGRRRKSRNAPKTKKTKKTKKTRKAKKARKARKGSKQSRRRV